MLLGVNLAVLVGPTVAVPAPAAIANAVQSVEVTHNDEGRSGFQMTLQVGRAGETDLPDYALLTSPLLHPFNRMILTVLFNMTPRVLMDGIITNQQLSPGRDAGSSTLTLTGEDVSVMMDLEQKRAEHPAQSEMLIAGTILARYAQYGIIPNVITPPTIDQPTPTERTPVQQATDLEYLNEMASRFGYVFYIESGPAAGSNTAYWGPPVRTGVPQRALSVNLGPESNVTSINFTYNALAATVVKDKIRDRQANQTMPVLTFAGTRVPPLASQPALPATNVRTRLLEHAGGALTYSQAAARAQGITDRSLDSVVTASGELDALLYGDLLKPRGLVGLRGAGATYDGLYYVKSVSHSVTRGQYKQRFTLTREGTGALTTTVIP